jgi:hypothetical protein
MTAACSNPAALGGGEGELKPYFGTGTQYAAPKPGFVWTKAEKVATPYVATPGLLSARCETIEGASVLVVHVRGDPSDPRTDDIPGDLSFGGGPPDARWGLHMVDANLTLGNLLDIVGAETRAYLAVRGPAPHGRAAPARPAR